MSLAAYTASTTPKEKRDLATTPWSIFHGIEDLLGLEFAHDVCATPLSAKCSGYYSPEGNALTRQWSAELAPLTPCWMNPPYSNPYPWVELANHFARCGLIVVGLLPVNTSASWFVDHINGQASAVYLPSKRIKFERPDGTVMDRPFQSSMIVLWTPWRTGSTQFVGCEL